MLLLFLTLNNITLVRLYVIEVLIHPFVSSALFLFCGYCLFTEQFLLISG